MLFPNQAVTQKSPFFLEAPEKNEKRLDRSSLYVAFSYENGMSAGNFRAVIMDVIWLMLMAEHEADGMSCGELCGNCITVG